MCNAPPPPGLYEVWGGPKRWGPPPPPATVIGLAPVWHIAQAPLAVGVWAYHNVEVKKSSCP